MSRSLRSDMSINQEEDIETVLNNCIILFRLVEAKDEFERHYKHHLCRRMLNDKIQSEDNEQSMIQKLKHECGTAFTTKLEMMYKDQQVYRNLNQRYKDSMEKMGNQSKVQIEVKVLTCGMWPISANMNKKNDNNYAQVPSKMREAFEQFKAFYLKSHENRRLTLMPEQGTGELKFTPNNPSRGKRIYTLCLNSTAMYILYQFNENSCYSVEELRKRLEGVPEKALKVALLGLTNPKQMILKRVQIQDQTEGKTQVMNSDRFEVNDDFQSKQLKIRVMLQKMRIEDAEASRETKAKVEDDRRYEIEAAAVRIMKARQKLSHNNLHVEIIDTVKQRFKPSVKAIKTAIEHLLDKEYLKRSADNAQTYEYVA